MKESSAVLMTRAFRYFAVSPLRFRATPELPIRVSAAAFLASMLLSSGLWFSWKRDFPNFSVAGFFVPSAVDMEVFDWVAVPCSAALVSALLGLMYRPGSRFLLGSTLVVVSVLILSDVHRLQPWVYQYSVTFGLALGIKNREQARLDSALLIMLAATYFWSGLQKTDPAFTSAILPALIRPFNADEMIRGLLHGAGSIVPFAEAGLGLGLLFPWTRRVSGYGLVTMHGLILIVLGPFGLGLNSVVWPWNLAMIILLSRVADQHQTSAVCWMTRKSPSIALMMASFIATPALNFAGYWPSYLSMNLYSGNLSDCRIIIKRSDIWKAPEDLQRILMLQQGDPVSISVTHWALCAMNVPAFPERIPLVSAGQTFQQTYLAGSGELSFRAKRIFTVGAGMENKRAKPTAD